MLQSAIDAIIRITPINLGGSDLHMYQGPDQRRGGTILVHESIGVVEAVGTAVDRITVGDQVSVPFNNACGTCRNCTQG